MDPVVQKSSNRFSVKKLVIISFFALIALSLAFTGYSAFKVLNYNKVYKGVYLNDLHVGGKTLDELQSMLKKNYQDSIKVNKLIIESKLKNSSEDISFADLNVSYDVLGTANAAFNIGRSGNVIDRLTAIINTSKNNKKIEIIYSFDKKKVEDLIDKLHKSTLISVKESDLLIKEDEVILRSGHHGERIDKDSTFKLVENTIKLCKSDPVTAPSIITNPAKINVENFYSRINKDVTDAVFKSNGKTYELKPHQAGRSIDKAVLISIASQLEKSEDTEKILPVIFVKPKVTLDDLHNKIFKDTISDFTTSFNTSGTNNANRGVNIKLAVSKINGIILAPGDIFSFNDIVGERTAEGGYQAAHTYVGGKVIDGIGGGICQVSTTLYNTALLSDLNITARQNHYFTVSYVPLGRDAAVSFGDLDFKFKNSTSWPIKIQGLVTANNKINFKFLGTNESTGKEIIITPKITKTLNFQTKYIDDPKLNEGQTKVNTSGGNGYIVDTYKIVKINNKVVSESKMHTSYYHPLTREVVRGTKKGVNPTLVPTPALHEPAPTPGVDDADNPPVKPTP